MCSNMCARPVIPGTSFADPTLTHVTYENTGAAGRSTTMSVSPLSSFLTVVRFSNEARSCAHADAVANAVITQTASHKFFRTARMFPPDLFEPQQKCAEYTDLSQRGFVTLGLLEGSCRLRLLRLTAARRQTASPWACVLTPTRQNPD